VIASSAPRKRQTLPTSPLFCQAIHETGYSLFFLPRRPLFHFPASARFWISRLDFGEGPSSAFQEAMSTQAPRRPMGIDDKGATTLALEHVVGFFDFRVF
jgi:hypothetical protein